MKKDKVRDIDRSVKALMYLRIEARNRMQLVFGQEKSRVAHFLKKAHDTGNRVRPMPIFGFDEQSREIRFESIGRTLQDRQFVSFDVNFDKPNVAQMKAVKSAHPYGFVHCLSRHPICRLNRRAT